MSSNSSCSDEKTFVWGRQKEQERAWRATLVMNDKRGSPGTRCSSWFLLACEFPFELSRQRNGQEAQEESDEFVQLKGHM
ncbi:unnamed protein product, partial [Lampetra planeri]